MGLRLINYVNNQLATPSMYASYLGARPSAGVLGRLFISTDTHEIYRDEGAGWNLIADAGAGSGGTLQTVTYNGNTTTNGIVIQSGDLYVSNGTSIYNSRLTNGSILFASSSTGKIDQDNSNFFWDATNFRLGIRTNAPAAALDVTGASPVVGIFNNSTTAATFLTFRTQTVDKWYIGNDHSNSDSYVIYDVTNTTNRLIITASGYTNLNTKLIVGNTTPSSTYQFDVYGSGRLTGALFTQSYFVAGGTALPTGWTGSIQTYSGLSSPAEAHIYNMGVVGTQLASSSNANIWGIGVYGAGYTNGGTRSAGVMGDGEVNASGDTGSAIGVRGYATATHSGGLNIGMLSDASGSSTGNYGFYTNMAAGSTIWANYHAGTAQSYFGGSVGIGVSPSYQLDLLTSIVGTTNTIAQFYNNDYTSGNKSFLRIRQQVSVGSTYSSYFGTGQDGNLYIYANNTARTGDLVINAGTGNVLIGTATDGGQKFQVSGTGYFSANLTSAGNLIALNSLQVNIPAGGNYQFYVSGVGNPLQLYNSNVGNIGNFNYTTGVYTPTSDINKKRDFELSTIGLNAILGLKPTLYRMNVDEKDCQKHLGFIAQEVKEFIPQAYVDNGNFIGLDYQAITSTLVKAIQELNEKLVRNNIN